MRALVDLIIDHYSSWKHLGAMEIYKADSISRFYNEEDEAVESDHLGKKKL